MTDTSWLGPAVDVRPVLAEQQAAFIGLLRSLNAGEWSQPTVCPGWSVKDIAVHVLAVGTGPASAAPAAGARTANHIPGRPRRSNWTATPPGACAPVASLQRKRQPAPGSAATNSSADRIDHLVAAGPVDARNV
jgi:hypothetical protein